MANEKRIYLVNIDEIPEDKVFSEMSDKWVEEHSEDYYNSIEDFLCDFNAELLDDIHYYAREKS